MDISSPAFKEGDRIPKKYTCDGEDISPEIVWSKIPEETKSLVLIMEDPDAPIGTFVHWVVYNIPPNMTGLRENFSKVPKTPEGIKQGRNDFGKIGYGGPCPPRGHGQHRYFFILYALKEKPDLKEGLKKDELMKIIQKDIIKEAKFFGVYSR